MELSNRGALRHELSLVGSHAQFATRIWRRVQNRSSMCDVNVPVKSDLERRLRRARELFMDRGRFRSRAPAVIHLLAALRRDLIFQNTIQILAYWGIGTRSSIGKSEERAWLYTNAWVRELGEILGSPIELAYILTDTHAEINQIDPATCALYVNDVRRFLTARSTRTLTMRELLNDPAVLSSEQRPDNSVWHDISPGLQTELIRLASQFSGTRDPVEVAMTYYAQNIFESAIISFLYPFAIFLTYQSPASDLMLPLLPKIHSYVAPNKTVKRPWFASD